MSLDVEHKNSIGGKTTDFCTNFNNKKLRKLSKVNKYKLQ